jgi:hypothetical protein
MNIPKQAYENVVNIIERKINETKGQLFSNRREINRIADKQRLLKKEVKVWYETLRSVKPAIKVIK